MPLALRLSPSQYRQSIPTSSVPRFSMTGSFEPETRVQGLLAIGARQSNVSDSGLESYDEIARGIADQVVDEQHRATFIGCTPHDPQRAMMMPARALSSRGSVRMIYRRPLTQDELQTQVERGGQGDRQVARLLRRAVAGLAVGDVDLSQFSLPLQGRTSRIRTHPGQERLNAYSKATELSYFLWNTTPGRGAAQGRPDRRDPHAAPGSSGRSIA